MQTIRAWHDEETELSHRSHARPSTRIWAGLAATAVAVTGLAAATAASASARPTTTASAFGDRGADTPNLLGQRATHGDRASLTASSASGSTGDVAEDFTEAVVTVGDPLNDTLMGLDQADILSATGELAADGYAVFDVKVDVWTNPETDPNWLGATGPIWYIDTDSDEGSEFYAWFYNNGGTFYGGVVDIFADELACPIAYDYDPTFSSYSLYFPTDCLGTNQPQIRMHAVFEYEDVMAGIKDRDDAPDDTWSAPIVNEVFNAAWQTLSTVQPYRLYDSRSSDGMRPAGSVTPVQVTGLGGVPVGAGTALLNVTAVDPAEAGFITVFPCGGAVPDASNLNFSAAQTIPNAVVVKLDADGKACVFTSAAAGVLVDVNGYTPADSDITALNPFRLYDSRAGDGERPAGHVTEVQVAGMGGVPADAAAALLNITAVSAAADGFMTVYPCGTPVPTASNLNYRAGQTIANTVLGRLGAGGRVCVYTSAAAGLLVDVNASVPAGSGLTAVDPFRLYDTRNTGSTIVAGAVIEVPVAGHGGVAVEATTALLNVTILSAVEPGFATVFPCGTAVPEASNLNYGTGDTIANAVVAKLGAGGAVCVFTSAEAGLLVDANGYAR